MSEEVTRGQFDAAVQGVIQSLQLTSPYAKGFVIVAIECVVLFDKKNNDYGPRNISEFGERGVYVRMWDKISRLKRLVWDNVEAQVKDESVEDTWMDSAVYSIIGLMNRRGMWKEETDERQAS